MNFYEFMNVREIHQKLRQADKDSVYRKLSNDFPSIAKLDNYQTFFFSDVFKSGISRNNMNGESQNAFLIGVETVLKVINPKILSELNLLSMSNSKSFIETLKNYLNNTQSITKDEILKKQKIFAKNPALLMAISQTRYEHPRLKTVKGDEKSSTVINAYHRGIIGMLEAFETVETALTE